jgi:hypothetical protein
MLTPLGLTIWQIAKDIFTLQRGITFVSVTVKMMEAAFDESIGPCAATVIRGRKAATAAAPPKTVATARNPVKRRLVRGDLGGRRGDPRLDIVFDNFRPGDLGVQLTILYTIAWKAGAKKWLVCRPSTCPIFSMLPPLSPELSCYGY